MKRAASTCEIVKEYLEELPKDTTFAEFWRGLGEVEYYIEEKPYRSRPKVRTYYGVSIKNRFRVYLGLFCVVFITCVFSFKGIYNNVDRRNNSYYESCMMHHDKLWCNERMSYLKTSKNSNQNVWMFSCMKAQKKTPQQCYENSMEL